MPHSSGGGSHSGGSHGGSHHSSSHGSRGRSFNRVSNSKFPGAKRYLYYRNNAPVFIYSNYDISDSKNRVSSFISFFLYIVILILVLGFIPGLGHFPGKIDISKYNSSIMISDTANVIDDEDTLIKSLLAFQDKTGITPCIITVHNEYWMNNYTDLEQYAYELYVEAFDDEKHWLIVYSEPANPNPDFNDWYWEGMQGDDTDKILTYKETGLFNNELQKGLTNKNYSVGEAISEAFDELTPVAMKKYIPFRRMIYPIVFAGFLLFMAIRSSSFHPFKGKYFEKAVECPETFVDQEKCEYCGGIYVVGMSDVCPNCAAPLKTHEKNQT